MKKLCLVIIVSLLFFSFCVSAKAKDTGFADDGVNTYENESESYKKQLLSILPELAYEKIGDKLKGGDVASLVGVDYLASLAFDALRSEGGSAAKSFCTLLAFVVFFALLSFFRDSLGQDSAESAEGMLLVISALVVCRTFAGSVEMAYSYITSAREFTASLVPITAGLYMMGGNTAAAVSSSAGAGAALLCIESLCDIALPTLIRTSLALTLVGSISTNVSYSMVCKSVRNTYVGVLGFFTTILAISLSFGNLIASASDSVAARAVKYAIGNMLPIVGGTVNSVYGTLSASVTLIKSTLGVSAVVAILVITLPVLVNLLLVRLSLNVCSDIAQMLDCSKISKLYSDFRAVYDLALAAVVFVSLVFIIIVSVFLKCASAIA